MSKPDSDSFVDKLKESLVEGNIEHLSRLISEADNAVLQEFTGSIVSVICSYLSTEHQLRHQELIKCCESILERIAEKCEPSEAILEFLGQVEYLEDQQDDLRFSVILRPLSKALHRIQDRERALEWCTSTLRSYVEGLAGLGRKVEEEEDDKLGDARQLCARTMDVYRSILSFLKPFIQRAALGSNVPDQEVRTRDHLLSILIFLLGRPLYDIKEIENATFGCSMPEHIIELISLMTGDMLRFLRYIDSRSRKSRSTWAARAPNKVCTNSKVLLFESTENIPQVAYANFYFNVLTVESLWVKVPQVYSHHYIFCTSIHLVDCLLKEASNVLVTKGLGLLQRLLQNIEKGSMTLELLELSIYSDLLSTITRIMIYCTSKKIRKNALQVFIQYIDVFNIEARYYIVLRLYEIGEHSGLLSLTTGILKTSIIECLRSDPPSPHFLGENLENLLDRACKLPHGSASDLVELSDEIITSLNLLRFLFIRDKENKTGVWNIVEKLRGDYLNPLREGIDLCKAHWMVKIKDLEERQKRAKKCDIVVLEKVDVEVTLTVGGEKLPAMPIAEKITFCHQAVNGLDVMQSILSRVNECIADHRSVAT